MGRSLASLRAAGRLGVRALVSALVFASLVSGRAASAQEGAAIELSGEIELVRLVELVTQRLGVSVQYQAPDLVKKVTLRLRSAPTDAELWETLVATLESQGLSVVRGERESLYRIVPAAQAPAQDALRVGEAVRETPEGSGSYPAGHRSVVVRLRSLDPAEAAASIGPLLTPQTGTAKPIGPGLILISDSRRKVEQALSTLDLIDAPADPASVLTLELERASAADIAALAAQILAATSGRGSSRGAPPLPAGSATSSLSGRPAGEAQFIPLPDDKRLLVVAPQSRHAEIAELVRSLDVTDATETRAYSSPHAPPEELAASIRAMLEAPVASGAARPTGRVRADRLLGSVLVSATAKDHNRVEGLLELVNSAPPEARQTLRSFTIRNRSAKELADTLERLLNSGALEARADGEARSEDPATVAANRSGISSSGVFTVPGAGVRSAEAEDTSAPPPSDVAGPTTRSRGARGLSLSVDEPTNTILAVGEPSLLRQLEALIAELDKRQPQVLIEASLVSLSESEALDFGVELRGQFEVGGSTVNLASLFGLAGAGGAGGPLAGGTGFTGTVINPGDFQVIVRALENINRGRAISSPKALVNNNATATLRGVNRQPFTSINASQTVATTSFGGTQDAGTTITVTPSIAAGDHLVLDYAVELSAFTGAATTTAGGGIIPPPSQQNSVEGSATIPDGFTVVIGGLDNASSSRGQSRVPLLGRIPILGALFGTTSESEAGSRFFVFIRATVLRHGGFEDLKQLSAPDLAAAGVSDGLPVLEPLWVE